MIVEERIYRIRPGRMSEYLALVREEGLAIQQPVLGNLIAYFVSEIGPLNHVVHMWGYDELADDPRWQAFTPRLSACIEAMENRILKPADFSPLK
jgi:hypothetical protein